MRVEDLSTLFTMADVLSRCSGMKKEDVYYLEHRGFVQPLKQRHGRVERNLYTAAQVELIAEMWKLKQEGLSPRKAYPKARQALASGQLAIWPEGDSIPEGETQLAAAGD